MKHLCVRPAKERLHKWERRFPLENEAHLGYCKDILADHIEGLKKLPPESPTYDKWLDSMILEHGSEFSLNASDFYMGDSTSWQMLLSHVPSVSHLVGKELIW